MQHPWFAGVDWDMILRKQIKPPFKPKLQSDTDLRYIPDEFTSIDVRGSVESSITDSLMDGDWLDFSYNGTSGLAKK